MYDKKGANTDKKAQEQALCHFEHFLSGGGPFLSNPSGGADFVPGFVVSP